MQVLENEVIENVIVGTAEGETLRGRSGSDEILGEGGDDVIKGREGRDYLSGGEGNDTMRGGGDDDALSGGAGEDDMRGGRGDDVLKGGEGNDQIRGGQGADILLGGAGDDLLRGGGGDDILYGGDGADTLRGGKGDDKLEGGAGNDVLIGGGGNDWLLGFSWGGEPVPAQDADALVNAGEPLEDTDTMRGGKGADTFEFRWLIDAKDEIIAKHTDENGDIDYSMNGVAGENDNVHDHWVEHIGVKIVEDYREGQGDTLVFAGHTVNLDTVTHTDWNEDGKTDTVLTFVSNQGGNGGAHDGDEVGTVVILNNVIDSVDVDAGVFYGIEEPWSAAG
jgi:Ca2+-binding RTX toxin-like protein